MRNVSGDELKEIITKESIVVLDIWAEWCRPCKAIEPYLKELESEYSNVKFVKLNADENSDVLHELGVISIPTVIYFKDGKEVNRIVGAHPKHKFKSALEEIL